MAVYKIQFMGAVHWLTIELLHEAKLAFSSKEDQVDFISEDANPSRLIVSGDRIVIEQNTGESPARFTLTVFVEVPADEQQIDLNIETSHPFEIHFGTIQITTHDNTDQVSLPLISAATHVILEDTTWYEHPAQASLPNGELKAGVRVIILNAVGSFTRIRTEDNTVTGYVSSDVLAPIAMNPGDDQEALAELASQGIAVLSSCADNPPPWENKPWRAAESLKQLLAQVNALAPNRNKGSDGTIGDIAHQNRTSDHNPHTLGADGKGIVTAIDITHDPQRGCDCNAVASVLQTSKDPRVKYVIWNRRIMNSAAINGAAPWTWRPYAGSNPHDKHIHISVKCDPASYDSRTPWALSTVASLQSTNIIT